MSTVKKAVAEANRLTRERYHVTLARSTGLPEMVAIQFYDTTLREAYGWWVYPAKHLIFDLE